MRMLTVTTLLCLVANAAGATTVTATATVDAKANIYGAAQTSAPGGGSRPHAVKLHRAHCVSFTSVTGSLNCSTALGCITLNNGANLNDPDGSNAQVSNSSNTGTALFSGIKAAGAGYLVGLFTTKVPSGAAPPALNFTRGKKTAFTRLRPLLDQTFFIGDGLTGDGTGTIQNFEVPKGAKRLYLGISDTCDNYHGSPGCYFDNNGTYTATVQIDTEHCPK